MKYLRTGSLPTSLFKKGDENEASNYRPISLTSVCSKLLEHILHGKIMNILKTTAFLQTNSMDSEREDHEDQLILTVQDLAAGLRDGEQIDAMILDYSKAFYKVLTTD